MRSLRALALWGVLATVPALAADATAMMRVGYVDLQKALTTTDAGKKAKDQWEKDIAAKKTALEKEQAGLQKEAEEFEKKAALLNETARGQKQQELQKKVLELQKKMAATQMELQKKERDLTKPIIDELRAIVETIGKERAFQLILEKNEGAVLYAESGSDLTEEVIKRFNQKKKK